MFPTNITVSVEKVDIDKKAIEQAINHQFGEVITNYQFLVDINKLAELTCMSKRWLEEVIISDSRFKSIEIKKERKRWWPASKAFEVIMEITSEW